MSGVITTSIPVTSATIAQSVQPPSQMNPDTASSNAANLGNQAAAVVSLSNSKIRSASRGDSRSVDGSFEKQEAKSETSKSGEKEKGGKKATLNVQA